ncbi:MAG: hypothetical protein NZ455_12995 [Bacteroidia bacterium]|nr:hypothetical protein [Bacteroidia bacterium]
MRRVREQCVAQRSTEAKRSPQHADLVGMSEAKRPQGHAQKKELTIKPWLFYSRIRGENRVNTMKIKYFRVYYFEL